jgi:hypothetical protein
MYAKLQINNMEILIQVIVMKKKKLKIWKLHNNVTNVIHFHFHNHFIVSWYSKCFGRQASIFRRHYASSFWCELRALLVFGWLQVVGRPAKNYNCTQPTPKTASVVPPEDGRLTPETCRGSRHNEVIVKVKVY